MSGYKLTQEEFAQLRKYGIKFRTATEVDYVFHDERSRKWFMRLMEIAYERGVEAGKNNRARG